MGIRCPTRHALYAHAPHFVRFEQKGLIGWWTKYLAHARTNNPHFNLYPYVASYDENPRLASFLKQHVPAKHDQKYRIAMYLLLSIGKYPVLYYGDELMQEGWKWNGDDPPAGDGSKIYDQTLREPFQWYKDQTGTGQTTWFLRDSTTHATESQCKSRHHRPLCVHWSVRLQNFALAIKHLPMTKFPVY